MRAEDGWENLAGQMSIFDYLSPDTWSGKTYQEPLVAIKEKTSEPSSRKQRKSQIKMPLFLDLRKNGVTQDSSWETDGALLGELTMHSFGECRRDANGYVWSRILMEIQPEKSYLMFNFGEKPSMPKPSKLSEVLEKNPDPKYNLSPKACQGILNRANRRGKELPPILKQALERQASLSKLGGGAERDCYGKKAGKGPLVQTELSATLGVSQDQTLITASLTPWDIQSKQISPENGIARPLYSGECRGGGGEQYVMQGINGDVAGTLDASYFKGCGERKGIERDVVCYGISPYDSNAMKSENPNSGIYEADSARTLDNNGGNPACNQGGMIVIEGNGSRESHRGDGYVESETMYTLNTVEQHAVCIGNGQVAQLNESDKVGALNCMHDQQAIITYGLDAHNVGANEEKTHTLLSGRNDTHNVPTVCYGLDRASFNQGANAKFDFSVEEELSPTIVSRGAGG